MSSESYFTLQAARTKLSETLALVLIDLDDMEAGINQLPKHELHIVTGKQIGRAHV